MKLNQLIVYTITQPKAFVPDMLKLVNVPGATCNLIQPLVGMTLEVRRKDQVTSLDTDESMQSTG